MNPFINVFTDSVDFDQVEWDDFTSLIATTDDIRYLLAVINNLASSGQFASTPLTRSSMAMSHEDEYETLMRCYAWVVAMTNNELAGSK